MVGEMSSILRELEIVQDRLSELTAADQTERSTLMSRQEELRTRAARLAEDVDSQCSTKELLIHLASLRRRRDVLNRQRHARGPGAAAPGATNTQVDERIARIRRLLEDRGIRVH